jgi:hypothetical protein
VDGAPPRRRRNDAGAQVPPRSGRRRFDSAAELRDAFAAALEHRLPAALRRRGADLLAREPWAMSPHAHPRIVFPGPRLP